MDANKRFGENLKRLRKEQGLSQERLAIEAEISTTNLRTIEHGMGNPTTRTAEKLAQSLHTDIANLYK